VRAAASSSNHERSLRRDRAMVAAGIATLTLLSWFHLTRMVASMGASAADKTMHAAMGMPEMAAWGWSEFVMLFLMWTVMMVAMMLPSAAPILLLVVATYRRRGIRATQLTTAFGAGYLLAWTGFSMAAAGTQLGLHRATVLSEDMAIHSTLIGGILLAAAGVYQWLPLKGACLTHCRSPLAFLANEWREGTVGALVMGSRHGVYCVGCCWALMALLFAAGVMNLFWVAVIALFVLIEKVAPRGAQVGRVAGVGLVAWGAWLVASGL
jgi:predicted metal-binding membrane protein